MVASSKIVKADHLSIELSTNAKNGLLDAAKKISATAKCSKTITTKDIHGVKNLSFSQTYITDSKGNQTVAMSYDYVCDLNDDFELKITGRYSNGKVTVPVMITHKKQKWSLGCEIVLTLNPLELLKNGLYLVGSIPMYGTQVVIKYNILTKDVVIVFRAPLPDGNDEDKKGAADAGCDLIYVDVDFARNYIYRNVYEYENIKHFASNYNFNYNYNTVSEHVVEQSNILENVGEVVGNAVEGVANFFGKLFTPTSNTNRVERNLAYN